MAEIIATLVVAIVLYQAYVTMRVVRSTSYDAAQKRLQCLLIWLLPFVGAAIAHAVIATDKELPVRPDKDFTPQDQSNGF